jgi:hypothetical protein
MFWSNLRPMRTRILAAFAVFCLASAARADDTKPPQISDVKASATKGKVMVEARITDETGVLSAICHHRGPGGKVEDTPMVKNDYDDVFKASFSGAGDTEYWIESSDLLGNGPATYGSASKAFAVGGAKAAGGGSRVAAREPAPREEPPAQEEPKEEPAPKRVAKADRPPVIEHRKLSIQPPDGRDFTLRMKIKSESPVAVAILQAKAEGAATFSNMALKNTDGESYEAQIPAAIAHGSVEYYIAAKNQAGLMTRQGDGDPKTPYVITFKAAAATAVAASTTTPASTSSAGAGPSPFNFTDLPPYRVPPGKPFVVRAQVVPASDDVQSPDRVAVLWRGADAQDQITDMVRDDTGGLGGYKAELPEQSEGAVFFQIVACDAQATKCSVDTGGKRKWHATVVSAQTGAAQPMPLDAVSSKGPPSLPE